MTGPLASSCPSSSARADPVPITPVAQLAVELVDEVAAVGEDQDTAGARRLDEAERRDRLAGAGGVLEPEALGGVGILGLLLELARPPRRRRPASPGAPRPRASSSSRLVVVVLVLVVEVEIIVEILVVVGRRRGLPRSAVAAAAPGHRCAPLPLPVPLRPLATALRCASASSAVRVPDRASTWWADRTVPSARCGSSSDSSRSSPSSSENSRRHSIDGCLWPASTSASAASSARRRAEPGARASSNVSPS